MFTGLSAFPMTPVTANGVDEKGFNNILARLTTARVDSMGILGSTGSYAYLTPEQRKRVATLAKQVAGDIPVMVCVGAVREGANKQVISSQADSLIKISRIWADFFPQTHRISLFRLFFPPFLALFPVFTEISPTDVSFGPPETGWRGE